MQPKMKPGNVNGWNGLNQKTVACAYFLFNFFLLHSFFVFLCELSEYNQWRSVIFTIDTTQRWIYGIAALCKIVVF